VRMAAGQSSPASSALQKSIWVCNLRRFFGLLLRVFARFYPGYFLGPAFSISWTNLQFLGVIAIYPRYWPVLQVQNLPRLTPW
jgi:hypothetical protein